MTDRFEDLRTFVAIVECGGVNAAAAELGIAKSAASRRLSDLEARLDMSLVERTTRSFQVTAVGRDYFRRAADILADLERLDGTAGSPERDRVTRISAPPVVLAHLVAPALARIDRDAPAIRLVVDDEQAEVVVSERTAAPAGDHVHVVAPSTLLLCASPDYLDRTGVPASPAEAARRQAILVDPRESWTFRGGGRRSPRAAVVVPDAETALAAASAGMGIAQLPNYILADAVRRDRLRTILDEHAPTPTHLVAEVRPEAPRAARLLVDALIAEARTSPPGDRPLD